MPPKVRDLDTLDPHDRFITAHTRRKGTLLYCSPSSATVAWDGAKRVNGTTKWGDTFAFSKHLQEAISLKTQVIKLVRDHATK